MLDLEMNLILSRRTPISYRNQSIGLQSKSMDWFLYDIGLRHERVKGVTKSPNDAKLPIILDFVVTADMKPQGNV